MSRSPSLVLPAHEPVFHTLANGLQVLLKEDPAAPIVSLQVWVRTGSIHEGSWLGAGLAHLLEHMLFNGTEKRGPRQISEDVQAAGAYINAYTSFDRTVYWIDTPPESTEACLEILGDMTLHATLGKEEFIKELDVIRREMTMSDDSPGSLAGKRMFATAFQQHPCRHPVIGHRQVFDQLTHEDLLTFYRTHYVPNNLFLVVSGPVGESGVMPWIEAAFGEPPRAAFAPPLLPVEPRQQGRRVVHEEGSTQLTHLRIAWHGPAVTHRDTGALDLVSTILGSGRSSRIYRKLREELQLVHSIGAFLYSMGDVGLFVIAAEVDPEKRAGAEQEIFRQIEELMAEGVTGEELEKALKGALSESLGALTTTRGVASDIGSSWLLTGNAEFTQDYVRDLQKLTADDLRNAARTYLQPENATITSLNPEGSLPPASARGTAARKRDTEKITLSNGLTLLLQRDARLPLLSIHAAFRGGLLAEPEGAAGLTRLYARLLTRDTHSRSSAEIAERIEAVGGDFTSFSGYNSFGLDAGVMAPDWKLGLETVAEALTGPAFAADSLERERDFQLATIRSEQDRPMTLAAQRLRDALFPGHPYRHPLAGTEASVNALDAAACEAYHQDHALARNGVLSVYGDIEIEAVRDELERLLGGLGEGKRLFTGLEPVTPITESVRIEETHDKEQAIVLVGYPAGGLYDEDLLTLELMGDACSDMSGRLYTRIREELGAAYSVGTSRIIALAGGAFLFYASTSAEQADEVEQALHEEIAHLARNGIAPDELERTRKSWHGSHKNRLQTFTSQARIHTLDELYDLGWNHVDGLPAKIDQIDGSQMQRVAEKHFLEQPHVVVRLLPK